MDSASQNGNKSQNEGLIDGWCVNGDDGGTGIMAEGSRAIGVRLKDKVRHTKVVRRVAAYLRDEMIGDRELTAIGIVDLWCSMMQREGGPVKTIVNWSGYTKNWKARVHQGIREALIIGALEEIKLPTGNRLCVSHKGNRIIELYDKMYEKVEEEIKATSEKQAAKVEARQIRKELLKSLRAA